jgi:PAS domain S-box-containing protein
MEELIALTEEMKRHFYLFHLFLKSTTFPILAINPDTSLRFVNRSIEKITGYSSDELIGKKIPYPWWRKETIQENIGNFQGYLTGGDIEQEELFQTKSDGPFWVKIKTTKVVNNGTLMYYIQDWIDVTAQKEAQEALKKSHNELELRVQKRTADLTAANLRLQQQIEERKQTEKQLLKSREQLRDLSAHLQSIREEERTIVAREIHDELGQTLTALNFDSSWLYNHLPQDRDDLKKKLKSMQEIINITMKQVKRLSTELRPGILDDLGIDAAIEWQANNFQDTTGISCDVYVEPEEITLDRERGTAIFRIFQETLTNVARHANASTVKVQIKNTKNRILLRVSDNGIGITEKQINSNKSLGILGIFERVRALNGEVRIKGVPGRGTTVTVTIPEI